jgi:hypothetical protein
LFGDDYYVQKNKSFKKSEKFGKVIDQILNKAIFGEIGDNFK